MLLVICRSGESHSMSVFTPPSPQPCQTWYGYRFTIAHHMELGVIAGGLASAPHSGAATVAPPAGAVIIKIKDNASVPIVRSDAH
jgi:hypothetical protein